MVLFFFWPLPWLQTAIQSTIEGVYEPHKCNSHSKLERQGSKVVYVCAHVVFYLVIVITLLEEPQSVHLSLKKGPNLENFHCFLCVVSVRGTMNHEETTGTTLSCQ